MLRISPLPSASAFLLLVLAVFGCGTRPQPTPFRTAEPSTSAFIATAIPLVPASLEPGAVRLPTNGAPAHGGCLGVGLDAVLRGDPNDQRYAWLDSADGRIDVFFPLGFVGRFAPKLEVLDEAGRVVARDGDHIVGGCWTVDDGPVVILADE